MSEEALLKLSEIFLTMLSITFNILLLVEKKNVLEVVESIVDSNFFYEFIYFKQYLK